MIFVEQSATLLSHTAEPEILLERAGRVCYKSEDKITAEADRDGPRSAGGDLPDRVQSGGCMNDTIAIPKPLLEVVFAIILIPVVVLSGAWALWMLWGWFALPAWGVLTFAQAVGLSALINFVNVQASKDDNKTAAWRSILRVVVGHAICVGIGGILRLCGAGS